MMTNGERIAYYRRLFKITQNEMAAALGVSRPFLSMLENDKTTTTQECKDNVIKKVLLLGQKKGTDDFNKVLEEIKEQSKKDNENIKYK